LLETQECSSNVRVAFDRHCLNSIITADWGNSFIISPSMFFHQDCFNKLNKKDPKYQECKNFNSYRQYFSYKSEYFENYLDDEDYYDETEQYVNKLMIAQSMNQNAMSNKEEILKTCNIKEGDMENEYVMNNLEDIISYSILQLKDQESKKKAANQIILTGGFAATPFLLEE